MFDFNKRDASMKDKDKESQSRDDTASKTDAGVAKSVAAREPSTRGGDPQETAVIGPSIRIDGELRGDEDLRIQGRVKGTIQLKKHTLTIGSHGKVSADIFANTVYVDGVMDGDLYAAERVCIRKTAQVRGNIVSPRVSLEDGAKFKGSIEMDPDAEALKTAFGDKSSVAGNVKKQSTKPESVPAASDNAPYGKSDKAPGKVAAK